MNPVSRVTDLFGCYLHWVDSHAVPIDPDWGMAARVWVDPRWSFLCLLFLVGIILHPPEGMPFRFCLFHLMSGIDCPGCGMTRALSHLAHGQAAAALHLHPFSPLILFYLIIQSISPFLTPEVRIRVAEGLTRHGSEVGILFWTLTGLFMLYGLGRASLQFVMQGGPLTIQGAPSFRMGW